MASQKDDLDALFDSKAGQPPAASDDLDSLFNEHATKPQPKATLPEHVTVMGMVNRGLKALLPSGESETPYKDPGIIESVGHKFAQGYYKDFSDEGKGALAAVKLHDAPQNGARWRMPDGTERKLTSTGDVYRAGRDEERQMIEAAELHHPIFGGVARFTGDVLSDYIGGKILGDTAKVASTAYQTAAGAATGMGASRADLTQGDVAEHAAQMAAETVLNGEVGYANAAFLGPLINKVAFAPYANHVRSEAQGKIEKLLQPAKDFFTESEAQRVANAHNANIVKAKSVVADTLANQERAYSGNVAKAESFIEDASTRQQRAHDAIVAKAKSYIEDAASEQQRAHAANLTKAKSVVADTVANQERAYSKNISKVEDFLRNEDTAAETDLHKQFQDAMQDAAELAHNIPNTDEHRILFEKYKALQKRAGQLGGDKEGAARNLAEEIDQLRAKIHETREKMKNYSLQQRQSDTTLVRSTEDHVPPGKLSDKANENIRFTNEREVGTVERRMGTEYETPEVRAEKAYAKTFDLLDQKLNELDNKIKNPGEPHVTAGQQLKHVAVDPEALKTLTTKEVAQQRANDVIPNRVPPPTPEELRTDPVKRAQFIDWLKRNNRPDLALVLERGGPAAGGETMRPDPRMHPRWLRENGKAEFARDLESAPSMPPTEDVKVLADWLRQNGKAELAHSLENTPGVPATDDPKVLADWLRQNGKAGLAQELEQGAPTGGPTMLPDPRLRPGWLRQNGKAGLAHSLEKAPPAPPATDDPKVVAEWLRTHGRNQAGLAHALENPAQPRPLPPTNEELLQFLTDRGPVEPPSVSSYLGDAVGAAAPFSPKARLASRLIKVIGRTAAEKPEQYYTRQMRAIERADAFAPSAVEGAVDAPPGWAQNFLTRSGGMVLREDPDRVQAMKERYQAMMRRLAEEKIHK